MRSRDTLAVTLAPSARRRRGPAESLEDRAGLFIDLPNAWEGLLARAVSRRTETPAVVGWFAMKIDVCSSSSSTFEQVIFNSSCSTSMALRRTSLALWLGVVLLACSSAGSKDGEQQAAVPGNSTVAAATLPPLPNLDQLAATAAEASAKPPAAPATQHAVSTTSTSHPATATTAAAASTKPSAATATTTKPPTVATGSPATNPTAAAAAASSTHPAKRPGLLSPSLFGAGGTKAITPSTADTHRRTTNAPTRPGAN
jgi:hypothetical protein